MRFIVLAGCIFFTGCSQKEPVELASGTFDVANQSILKLTNNKGYNKVPKDKSFTKQRYSYIINTEKVGNTFFDNEIIVRSFYLLHHANLIIITGNSNIVKDYIGYLKDNGVSAPIEVNNENIESNKVIIDTIHYSSVPNNDKG